MEQNISKLASIEDLSLFLINKPQKTLLVQIYVKHLNNYHLNFLNFQLFS